MGVKVLATDVHVEHPDSGDYVVLRAGSKVPGWAKDLVNDERKVGSKVESRGLLVDLEEDESDDDKSPQEKPLAEWTVKELKAEAKKLQVPQSGTQAELVERITAARAEDADEEDESDDDKSPQEHEDQE